jgi:putative aldouronate transport system permease protein
MSRITNMETATLQRKPKYSSNLKVYMKRNRVFYIMLIPAMIYYITFRYIPLIGSIIAFKDYNIFRGFSGSEWVGLKWFAQLITYPKFPRLMMNTLAISLYQIIFSFPAPIILALLMNELRHIWFKRSVQTIIYLPHFLSWSVVAGLAYMLLSVQTGLVNKLLLSIGLSEPIHFLQRAEYVRSVIIGAGMWRDMGWGTILFLAGLSSISPSLYESATIDGAGRWKQCLYITIPGLLPTIVVLLLLKIGNVMDLSFEQIYPFLNPITTSKGDVFDTFIYSLGVRQGQYSFTTAISLFKSVLGFTLLYIANKVSKYATGEGLY